MTLKFYDLCGAQSELRFSPFCWLARLALAHKGLKYETTLLRFTEKQNYPDPDYGKLPILVDGDKVVTDSWSIVCYLEATYPERPLAHSSGEWAAAEFFRTWTGAVLFPPLVPFMMKRVHAILDKRDQDYFRDTREKRFGANLESLDQKTMSGKESMEAGLATLMAPLGAHDFLGGAVPNISDYIVFSPLQWQRCVTSETFYDTPAPVVSWMDRMLEVNDGVAGRAMCAGDL